MQHRNTTTAPAPSKRAKTEAELLSATVIDMLLSAREPELEPEPIILASTASEWRAAWLVSL